MAASGRIVSTNQPDSYSCLTAKTVPVYIDHGPDVGVQRLLTTLETAHPMLQETIARALFQLLPVGLAVV